MAASGSHSTGCSGGPPALPRLTWLQGWSSVCSSTRHGAQSLAGSSPPPPTPPLPAGVGEALKAQAPFQVGEGAAPGLALGDRVTGTAASLFQLSGSPARSKRT